MSKSVRFGLALSSAALACALAGCATPQGRSAVASSFGGKADGDTGLALRALAAMNANDIPAATGFAERAVARTPDDAGYRALLGNIYFAAGRFASAEAAYKDALSIYSNQPQVVLKLALAEIAQGKAGEAAAFLGAAREVLDPADYGLALALSGRPADAAEALREAARLPKADARVRQNLALAYALSGDWANARLVAAQDLGPDQVDARLQQWMQLAKPAKASDQVAALTGIAPAAADPGQPTRLALRQPETRVAAAAPVQAEPAPQQVAEAAPQQVAEAAPQPAPMPVAPAVFTAPAPLYGMAAAVAPAPPPPNPERIAETPAPVAVAAVAEVAPQPVAAPQFVAPPAPLMAEAAAEYAPPPATRPVFTRAAAQQRKVAKLQRAAAIARHATLRRGGSTAVVQLGAYGSPQRVLAAWNAAAKRYPSLRAYAPMSAAFASARGKVYRLSVRGFANQSEAGTLCASLRRSGGSCFVRSVAGDAPVQYAAR